MDGMLIDLLHAKWNAFVKSKFYKQFFLFAFYFLISLVSFTLRPGPPLPKTIENASNSSKSLNTIELDNITLLIINSTRNIKNISLDIANSKY